MKSKSSSLSDRNCDVAVDEKNKNISGDILEPCSGSDSDENNTKEGGGLEDRKTLHESIDLGNEFVHESIDLDIESNLEDSELVNEGSVFNSDNQPLDVKV